MMRIVVAIVLVGSSLGAVDRKTEAQRVWADAITAKGGNEALRRVRSIAQTCTTGVRWMGAVRRDGQLVRIVVPPSRMLEWTKGKVGPTQSSKAVVLNAETQFSAISVSIDGRPETPHVVRPGIGDLETLVQTQLFALLETDFLRPAAISVSRGWVGGTRVFRLKSEVKLDMYNAVYEWYFDQRSLLPRKVFVRRDTSSGEIEEEVRFDEYKSVSGIQLAHRITSLQSGVRSPWIDACEYEVNVEVDRTVFDVPASALAGPALWMKTHR